MKLNHLSYAARERLYQSCVDLAYKRASAYSTMPYEDYRDIKQAALMGLWEAAKTFQPIKGYQFSTHAHWQIRKCITREYKKKKKFARDTFLDPICGRDSITENDLSNPLLSASIEDPEIVEPIDAIKNVREYLDCLDQRSRTVVVMLYFQKLTYDQIGDELGLTYYQVHNILRHSVRKMRRMAKTQQITPNEIV